MIPRERTLPQQIFLTERNALGRGALMKSPEDHRPLYVCRNSIGQIDRKYTQIKSLKLYYRKASYKCVMELCNHCLDQMLSEKMDLNLLNIFWFCNFQDEFFDNVWKKHEALSKQALKMHSGMRQGWACSDRWQKGLITVFIFLQMCVLGGQLDQEKSHPPIGKI